MKNKYKEAADIIVNYIAHTPTEELSDEKIASITPAIVRILEQNFPTAQGGPRPGYAEFLGINGYDIERLKALETLQVGHSYRVTGGSMGHSSTKITLEGIKGNWNSVMFDVDLNTCPIDNPYLNVK